MLYIFSGLPGVGKTTLARAFARQIQAVYVRIDTIETAMKESTLNIHPAEDAGYIVGRAVAMDNLKLGHHVVTDSVNPLDITRRWWHECAKLSNVAYRDIEVLCSDVLVHQKRVEARKRDMAEQSLPTWQDVVDREYKIWTEDCLQIDTAFMSPEAALQALTAATTTT